MRGVFLPLVPGPSLWATRAVCRLQLLPSFTRGLCASRCGNQTLPLTLLTFWS